MHARQVVTLVSGKKMDPLAGLEVEVGRRRRGPKEATSCRVILATLLPLLIYFLLLLLLCSPVLLPCPTVFSCPALHLWPPTDNWLPVRPQPVPGAGGTFQDLELETYQSFPKWDFLG